MLDLFDVDFDSSASSLYIDSRWDSNLEPELNAIEAVDDWTK